MNPILYRAILASQAAAFDPDAVALFAAMTTQPNAARKTLISDTIVALKAAGVWSLLDAVWFMAAHDSQASRLNWKAPTSFTLAEQGTIAFTTDRGWQGNGTTGYLNTGWIPATHGVNYTLNDASFGVYSRTDTDNATFDIGAVDAPATNMAFMQARNSGTFRPRANQNTVATTFAVPTSLGLSVARRVNSSQAQGVKNGILLGSGADSSTTMPSFSFFIAARNNGGSPESPTIRQYALAFTAAAMSEAQQLALYTTTQAYMTAVGAAV